MQTSNPYKPAGCPVPFRPRPWLACLLVLLIITGCAGKSSTPTPPAATATPTAPVALRATATTPPMTATPDPATPAQAGVTPAPVISGRSIGDPYTPELGNTGY